MIPDELDWKIIDSLRSNGRISNAEIARKLKIAEGTVRQRIKKLTDAGILRVVGQVNPEYLEDHQLVLVGINVKESQSLEKTLRQIAKLPQVKSAAIVSGRYDVIAEVLVDSNKGIINFLAKHLARIPAVGKTETFVTLKTSNMWV